MLFFAFALVSGLEDVICLLILGFPYLLIVGFSGLIFGLFLQKIKSPNKLFSIVFLPFLLMPIESFFSNQKEDFKITSSVKIEASKADVWNKIIEVPKIEASEYKTGFYNYIGIPRPLKSTIKVIDGVTYRVGHFTDDLKLFEAITEMDEMNYVTFEIDLQKSTLRDLPTDKHILQSDYFKFDKIAYELVEIDENNVELQLSCSYSIQSKMNGYANFWAESIIKDFEVKLLEVLKNKIE